MKIMLDEDELKQIVVDHLMKLGWTMSVDAVIFLDGDGCGCGELTATIEGAAKPTTPDGATVS